MGGTQRVAAVAAISHARHYYNVTNTEVGRGDSAQYGVNIFFMSATLCGVVIAVCAACWPRTPQSDKPDDAYDRGGHVYTVSDDVALRGHQILDPPPGPPPAYESVIDTSCRKDAMALQEIIIEPNMVHYHPAQQPRPDTGLPSYEAAVMLRDTKL